jgi:hypothetical protein
MAILIHHTLKTKFPNEIKSKNSGIKKSYVLLETIEIVQLHDFLDDQGLDGQIVNLLPHPGVDCHDLDCVRLHRSRNLGTWIRLVAPVVVQRVNCLL